MRAEKYLVLSVGIEVDLGFVCGPKITGFCVSVEFDLVFVQVGESDLNSVGTELNLISIYGRN